MRVLHLAGEYPPMRIGGISTFLENLTAHQARAHEVGVVVVPAERYRDDPPRDADHASVRVGSVDVDFAALDGPIVSSAALEAMVPPHPLLSEPWDVLHVHDWYGVLPALAASNGATRAPRIVMSAHLPLRHGFTYANHGVPLRAKVKLEALGVRIADLVVAPSQHVAQLLHREYDVAESKIRVVHNGVDLDAFTPGSASPADGAADAGPMLLAVNRMSAQKGLSHLLDAFERVRATIPTARLEVAGEGPAQCAFEAEVAARGLGGSIRVHGYVPHAALLSLYRRASVFVSPSIYEPFGLTTIEAMASGTAVVASSLGGATEFVRDGVDGFVRAPHEGFAQAILAALADAESMGRAARERAESFGWHRASEAIARCYEEPLREPT